MTTLGQNGRTAWRFSCPSYLSLSSSKRVRNQIELLLEDIRPSLDQLGETVHLGLLEVSFGAGHKLLHPFRQSTTPFGGLAAIGIRIGRRRAAGVETKVVARPVQAWP
jgi:hypothetical protein